MLAETILSGRGVVGHLPTISIALDGSKIKDQGSKIKIKDQGSMKRQSYQGEGEGQFVSSNRDCSGRS